MNKNLYLVGVLLFAYFSCEPVSVDGCSTDDPPYVITGKRGEGTFRYICVDDPHDGFCSGPGSVNPDFPVEFPVSGRFTLLFELKDNQGQGGTRVAPQAGNSILELTGIGEMRFVQPGTATVVALDEHAEVIDEIELNGVLVDHLSLNRPSALSDWDWSALQAELLMYPAQSTTLRALPHNGANQVLPGILEYHWSTKDPAVIKFPIPSLEAIIEIHALNDGKTVVTVSAANISAQLPVIVGPDIDTNSATDSTTDSQ